MGIRARLRQAPDGRWEATTDDEAVTGSGSSKEECLADLRRRIVLLVQEIYVLHSKTNGAGTNSATYNRTSQRIARKELRADQLDSLKLY